MAYPSNRRIPPERLVRHKRVVYIIKPACLDYVKIGVTTRICQRLYELQAGNPQSLRVVAMFAGSVDLEAKLHYTFIRHHSCGEWFRLGPDIKAMLSAMHRPGFDIDEWLSSRFCGKPPSDGDIKRYIGGKVTLGRAKDAFGDPDRKARAAGRLTEEAVRYILQNPENKRNADLARKFDVSRVMIGRIRNGHAWQHIGAEHLQEAM